MVVKDISIEYNLSPYLQDRMTPIWSIRAFFVCFVMFFIHACFLCSLAHLGKTKKNYPLVLDLLEKSLFRADLKVKFGGSWSSICSDSSRVMLAPLAPCYMRIWGKKFLCY